MSMTMRNEVVMKRILSTTCVLCLVCSVGMSQTPKNAQPQRSATAPQKAPPSAQQPPSGQRAAPSAPAGQRGGASAAPEDFIIGAEDVLDITVWREPDLASKVVVRPDVQMGVSLY